MNSLMKATMALLVLVGLTACSGEQKTAQVTVRTVNTSLHWDELAAANTAASVKNNNLIMMR